MTDTLTDLERLARAATPGPYTAELVQDESPAEPDIWRVHGADDSYEATICECWTGEQNNEAQARYIAALSPERVIALIAVIRAAKAMRREFRYGDSAYKWGPFDAALSALEKGKT